jgi:hypothetical protein
MNKLNIFWAVALAISISIYFSNATPLDDYVYKPDDHYRYEIIKQYTMDGYTLYVLNMTSQKWLDGKHYIN